MILQAERLNIFLQKDGRALVEDFSFTLKKDDKVALIGEEGDGKSTLLKVLCGEKDVFSYVTCTGTVERSGHFAYLAQFLSEAERETRLCDFFEDTDIYGHYFYLTELHLSEETLFSERTLCSLSGGERVKARLFKLLCGDPDALFLDEPSNDLDLETVDFLGDFLRDCPVPVLFISHDEALIARAANAVVHLEQLIKKTKSKVTVARMDFNEYKARRAEGFERQTQIALKERADYKKKKEKLAVQVEKTRSNTSWKNPDGIPSSDGRAKRSMQSAAVKSKKLEEARENFTEIPDRENAILARFDDDIALPNGKRVLDLSLDELLAGETVIAKNISLSLVGGEHVCIVGKNGAGKSTLLHKIYEMLRTRDDLRVGYMPQSYADVLDVAATPVEYLQAHYDKALSTRAFTLLGQMKFTQGEMRSRIGQLSGGQQAKLIFLNMVLQRANVLVLDEPTRNFSPLSSPAVRAAIRSFGGAVIAVSHDRSFIEEADRVYLLQSDGLSAVR